MPERNIAEGSTERLEEHEAFKAWRQIQPESFEPEAIELLKWKKKSAVYRLRGVGPNGAIIAKQCQATTAAVERTIYEEFLPSLPLPSLGYYGCLEDPDGQSWWLFLEEAGGDLYAPHDPEHRAVAGRWLAAIHSASPAADLQALLPDRGPGHYLQLLRRTRAALLERLGNPALRAEKAPLLRTVAAHYDAIEAHWDELKKFFDGLPRAVVHGDFVIKNLRIRNGATAPALLVFDWEMAGWGVPATDLAQSIGRCVSPDLAVYGSALKQEASQLDARDIRRLADYGNLLRVMDKIFWQRLDMVGDRQELLVTPFKPIKKFEPELAAALRALDWT